MGGAAYSGPCFLKTLAGRLASQPCIWLPPSIFVVYYWTCFSYHGLYFPYSGRLFSINRFKEFTTAVSEPQ